MTREHRLTWVDRNRLAPNAGAVRLARAFVVAGLTVALSVAAHVVSCRDLPNIGLVGIGLASIAWLVWSWADVELSGRTLGIAVVGGQIGLHLAYALGSATHPATGTAHTMGSNPLAMSPGAAIAHLVAAGSTALLLRRTEQWVWRVLSKVAEVVACLLGTGPRAASLRRTSTAMVAPSQELIRTGLQRAHSMSHRGPPLLG